MKRAAVALINRDDGRFLCVWNKRYGGWSFPGGLVEDNETVTQALVRELREETGLELLIYAPLFAGTHNTDVPEGRASHVYVYKCEVHGDPREMELGCPVTWFTRHEFLKWSPFAKFYERVFAFIDSETADEC